VHGAITFDFHNTLVRAERWFALEVHELPAAFLRWQSARTGLALPAGAEDAARRSYCRLRQQITEHGHELPAERCVAVVLGELGLSVDGQAIESGIEDLMRETLSGAEATPGAVETVNKLAESGITLGVVSSAVFHPFLEWSLERFGMRDAFTVVTTSANAGYYKSRTEIFHGTLQALGASPDRSIHVGDSYRYDVATARRAGMRTVWLSLDGAPDGAEPADLTLPGLDGAARPILDFRASFDGALDAR
jgi:putative hydrolase of the HAD superfamily